MTGKPIEAFGRDAQQFDREATKAAVREADAPETIALTQSQQAILNGLSGPMLVALERLCKNFCWADGRSVTALERRGLAVSRMLIGFGETPDRMSAPTQLGREVFALRTTLLQANRNGK